MARRSEPRRPSSRSSRAAPSISPSSDAATRTNRSRSTAARRRCPTRSSAREDDRAGPGRGRMKGQGRRTPRTPARSTRAASSAAARRTPACRNAGWSSPTSPETAGTEVRAAGPVPGHNGGMRNSTRAATALLAALAILAAPVAVRTARADDTADARQHYAKGKQLFDGGDYRGAMAEFATADKLAPSPLLEFNIALCHERLGEKAEAVRRYRLYLDRVPDAQNRTQVEQKIHQLESEMKSESAPPPPAT